jgi:hypothetical protein
MKKGQNMYLTNRRMGKYKEKWLTDLNRIGSTTLKTTSSEQRHKAAVKMMNQSFSSEADLLRTPKYRLQH